MGAFGAAASWDHCRTGGTHASVLLGAFGAPAGAVVGFAGPAHAAAPSSPAGLDVPEPEVGLRRVGLPWDWTCPKCWNLQPKESPSCQVCGARPPAPRIMGAGAGNSVLAAGNPGGSSLSDTPAPVSGEEDPAATPTTTEKSLPLDSDGVAGEGVGSVGWTPSWLRPPTSMTRLFVGGLDYASDEESLRAWFGQFGAVRACEVRRDKTSKKRRISKDGVPMFGRSMGFGFVEFEEPSGASAALAFPADSHEVDGKRVSVKPEDGKGEKPAPVRWINPDPVRCEQCGLTRREHGRGKRSRIVKDGKGSCDWVPPGLPGVANP